MKVEELLQAVQDEAVRKHHKKVDRVVQYGTAGFRTKANLLDHVMFRMGALAVLRARVKKAAIGVMVTASHNPEQDNGVKLVDPKGEMLEQAWEALATDLANVEDKDIFATLNNIVASQQIPFDGEDAGCVPQVFIGRDTRASSDALALAVADGVKAAGGLAKDCGVITTPQLHYLVVCQNTDGGYGECSEEGYFDKLSRAFVELRSQGATRGKYEPRLRFDGSNGVGAVKVRKLMEKVGLAALDIGVSNDGTQEGDCLNSRCGADFVKVNQTFPKNFEAVDPGVRCVSVDGDADRVVYFYKSAEDGSFVILDGDKIAILVAGYLKELLGDCGLDLDLGLVQTAYANGSSTKYIGQDLQVRVECTPTGVKHLHHKALAFDIGVYFEANGHGTVVFSDRARSQIRKAAADRQGAAAAKLALVMDLINETVGDALSDMLLVETVLHAKGWDVQDWNAMYQDLPNRQLKVLVADRNAIETEDAERKCVRPPGLQDAIDKLVSCYPSGRSFVRPSGTEDVVRVYAEADTQKNADDLAVQVGLKVYEMAGGAGDPPSKL